MSDGRRYDSAMFWLAFGTAAAVIGLALMTIGVARSSGGANLFVSLWFDGGLALLGLGCLLLLWSLWLFLRRGGRSAIQPKDGVSPKESAEAEAVRGYYAERERLFKLYEQQRNDEKGKS